MIASQKTHIDELVQKTRTLDNTIKHLQEQLSNSRGEWQADRKEWVDGCDSLLACYRIAHLRTNVLLAQERVTLAHERDVTHRERIAVIQRDYNLILFKAREKELERLKEQLRGAANGNVALVAELRGKLAAGMQELKERAALLRDAEKAKEEAEVRHSTLPQSYAYMVFPSFFFFFRNRPRAFALNMPPCRLSSHLLAQTSTG
jgi:DNA repair exonuclease SbcCD ATPase subunit